MLADRPFSITETHTTLSDQYDTNSKTERQAAIEKIQEYLNKRKYIKEKSLFPPTDTYQYLSLVTLKQQLGS